MANQNTGIFDKKTEDFQVPLMNVFRSAVGARDERASAEESSVDDKKVSVRHIESREGVGYERLKDYFLRDLSNLMCTVHMEATQDLNDFPMVRSSVLNYGVLDVSNISESAAKTDTILRRFRQALLDHEPRLIPDSVVVKPHVSDDTNQRMAFRVEAILAARPVDVPLEFVAEIDVGSGKVLPTKVAVHE